MIAASSGPGEPGGPGFGEPRSAGDLVGAGRSRRVVVEAPRGRRGRVVRVGSERLGVAHGLTDLAEFLRRAGLDTDPAELPAAPWIDWRGAGPDVWSADEQPR